MSATEVVSHACGPSEAAVILLDSQGLPVCHADEALRILLYAGEPPAGRNARRAFAHRFRALFPEGPLSDLTPPTGQFLSGRRRYLYQIHRLTSSTAENHAPAAVILFERYRPPWLPAPAVLAPFRLTAREAQVLPLVLQGLSNKQIAEAIGVSRNTVKAFLHLIMTKMGVSSRFAILSKLLGPAVSADDSGDPPAPPTHRYSQAHRVSAPAKAPTVFRAPGEPPRVQARIKFR